MWPLPAKGIFRLLMKNKVKINMTNNDKSERRSVIIIQSLVHRREGFALVGRGEEEDGCGSYSGVTRCADLEAESFPPDSLLRLMTVTRPSCWEVGTTSQGSQFLLGCFMTSRQMEKSCSRSWTSVPNKFMNNLFSSVKLVLSKHHLRHLWAEMPQRTQTAQPTWAAAGTSVFSTLKSPKQLQTSARYQEVAAAS